MRRLLSLSGVNLAPALVPHGAPPPIGQWPDWSRESINGDQRGIQQNPILSDLRHAACLNRPYESVMLPVALKKIQVPVLDNNLDELSFLR